MKEKNVDRFSSLWLRLPQCYVQTALMMASRPSHRAVDMVYFHFSHFLQK